jgi:hypothetical protein
VRVCMWVLVVSDEDNLLGMLGVLGGFEKRREVRKLVGCKCPFLVCLQETKLMQLDDFICSTLWGTSNFGYSFRPSEGASGGLLIIWDKAEVEIYASFSFDHVWK